MSVMKGYTTVMRMPTVLMWWEDLTVPVTLDSLEMVSPVKVIVSCSYSVDVGIMLIRSSISSDSYIYTTDCACDIVWDVPQTLIVCIVYSLDEAAVNNDGLEAGATAAIVIIVLLIVVAAVVAGVIIAIFYCYKHKMKSTNMSYGMF